MTYQSTEPTRSQRGIAALGFILIIVAVGVTGGAGWFVLQRNKAAQPTLGATTSLTATDNGAAKIRNFYDCFEANGRTYRPGSPNTCTARGKTFDEPTKFSADNIRGMDRLQAGVRGQVFTSAARNFSRCAKDNQEEANVPVTQVLSVLGDDWAYIGLSCSDSITETYQRQPDGSWLLINSGNSKVSCATADQYQIPKELYLTSANPDDHDRACRQPDGSEKQIEYTYKPSGLVEDAPTGSGQ